MRKFVFLTVVAISCSILLSTCSDKEEVEDTVVPVSSVIFSTSSLTLKVYETKTLTAFVYPEDATNKELFFESSNPFVATVLRNGLVTAISPGMATIIASTEDGDKTASCTVIVTSGVTQIRFRKNVATSDVYRMRVTYSYGLLSSIDVEHDFGEETGTSQYYDLPPGEHRVQYNSRWGGSWEDCLDFPYNFLANRKYSVVYGTTGGTTGFYVTDDGTITE